MEIPIRRGESDADAFKAVQKMTGPHQDSESPGRIALDALDSLLEGCQVIGFDWKYLYVNDTVIAQGRQSREQLLGRTMMECYPGIESTPMFDSMRRCMTDRAHHRMENEFSFPDGSKGWFQLRFVPVPQGVCVLSLDITDAKRAEEATQRANEGLRLLVDGVRDHAIFAIDPRGRVVTWNAGAQRLKGYSAEDVIGTDFRRFYLPEDVASGTPDKDLQTALASGRAEIEGWRIRKDDTRFWANVVITPLSDGAGAHFGFVKVTRDLTERRKLEEQLLHAQKMEAVGRLAGGVAHDFNNVLSVILSYAEMIAADLKPDEPLRADVQEIRAAGLRAADLTRQLLAFSRQQVLEATVLNLNQSIAGMEKMVRRLLGADVELMTLPASGLWNVKADAGQVEQVVMNLAVNARDAMPRGGKLTIETANVVLDEDYARAHVDVSAGSYVMLAMTDSGAGMDRETQAHIFEPFFTTKDKGKGTGLGLSTVFGIVKQSGGHIWVYSEAGKGTTFKVYFPRVSGPAGVRASERPPPEPGRGSETILLVEDDDQVRALARSILRRSGYFVLEAPNGGEALLVCEQHGSKIHLLLTDVVLPRMSGRQLAERLAPMRPEMKVLFMSGYTDDAILHHGVLDSGVAYLQKPLTPGSLTRKVREVLDGNGR